tara:strand:- start:299 stop:511 length:213 start_codon:yes stop_codon:yes gene_type:complete
MLYPNCPTCGKLLADIEVEYLNEIEVISNKKLDQEKIDEAKRKLLDKLNVKRYCCRTRVLTFIDEVKLII